MTNRSPHRDLGSAVLVVAVFAGALALPSPATNDPVEGSPEFQRNLLRWQAMSDADKAQVRDRYDRWKALPEVERDRVRRNYTRYHELDPEEQRTLRTTYEETVAVADQQRRSQLRRRLQRFRQLDEQKRQRALAVGLMLDESGQDVQQRLADRPEAERRRALAALRDVYRELPPQMRQRLGQLPPWRRRQVIRHVIAERRGRFAQLYQSTLAVPPERFVVRGLLRQLTPDERRVYHQLPPQMKHKVGQQLLRLSSDEQRLRQLRKWLRNAEQRMKHWKRGRQGRPGSRRPERPGKGSGTEGAEGKDAGRDGGRGEDGAGATRGD